MANSRRLGVKTATQTWEQTITLGGRLSRRTLLIAAAVAGMAAGLSLGWSSLVAAGLAPIILALLPCAAMCALGLCAKRLGPKKECSSAEEPAAPKEPDDAGARGAVESEPLRSAAESVASRDRA